MEHPVLLSEVGDAGYGHHKKFILRELMDRPFVTIDGLVDRMYEDCADGGATDPRATVRVALWRLRHFDLFWPFLIVSNEGKPARFRLARAE